MLHKMAITNLHPVTSTVGLALNYIKRDKFELHDNKMERCKTLTSYMNCVEENDKTLFAKQRQYYINNGHLIKLRKDGEENLAFHMVQSFEEKVDPEIANEIGRRLAEELLSEYSCVISTHSNGDYTHNHFIFNAYKMDGSGKWNDCDKTKNAIRSISDRLCEEYGLSVIDEHREFKPIHWKDKNGKQRTYEPSKRKEKLREDSISSGQNSFDMIQKKINRSLKREQSLTALIKSDIDEAVKKAVSYDNMLQLLAKKGYTINSKKKDGTWLKHISFTTPDSVKAVTDRSLGLEYSRVALSEKIAKMTATRIKDFVQTNISHKANSIESLSSQKPNRANNTRIEYLKNCIDANLAALHTIEKFGILTFVDFQNRLVRVSERTNLLNFQLDDLQKRILKICGMSSVFRYFSTFETELYRFKRKYDLLYNFYDECSSCISSLQRVDRENNKAFNVEIKSLGLFASRSLSNIRNRQALLSNIIENGINAETEYPLIKSLSVLQLTTIAKMRSYSDYTAAKAGDSDSAFRLVQAILNAKEQQIKIKELGRKYPDAILVGVFAEEATGKNKIPFYLVRRISEMTGIEYDRSIVQINKVGRTGSGAIYRLANRPKFAGTVQPGRKYILTDDVITAGGTLSELRCYIESRGGEVVQLVTGGASINSTNFSMSAKTRFALESKYGIIPLMNFVREWDIYGGKLEYLTESEGSELLRFKSLDAARDRIIAERHGRSGQEIRGTERTRIPENIGR